MHIQPVPALTDNYIWLLSDTAGHALIVDPGESAPVEEALARQGLSLEAILLTHHHADHAGGVAALKRAHACRVFAPVDERIEHVDVRVAEGTRIQLEAPRVTFATWEVPGHTRSHVAYVGEGLVFAGDTLFSLGCGRLFEGSPAQMLRAMDRLAALPGDTRLCCAHEYTLANGAFAQTVAPTNTDLANMIERAQKAVAAGRPSLPSTLAEECAANPFLRVDSAEVQAWCRVHAPGASDREARFAALRAAKDGFRA